MHNGGAAASCSEREERIRSGIDLEGIFASMGTHSRPLLGKAALSALASSKEMRRRRGVVEEEAAHLLD
jgi:hypothetical protein